MEIKIVCYCGAKYQFPVQPVNGMMPQSIACPVCGTDNTTLANAAIAEQLGPAPSAPAPGGTPIKPVSSGLKIRAAEPAHASPPPATAPPPMPSAPAMHRPVPKPPSPSIGSKIMGFGKAVVSIILILLGILVVYAKWARRVGKFTGAVAPPQMIRNRGGHCRSILVRC